MKQGPNAKEKEDKQERLRRRPSSGLAEPLLSITNALSNLMLAPIQPKGRFTSPPRTRPNTGDARVSSPPRERPSSPIERHPHAGNARAISPRSRLSPPPQARDHEDEGVLANIARRFRFTSPQRTVSPERDETRFISPIRSRANTLDNVQVETTRERPRAQSAAEPSSPTRVNFTANNMEEIIKADNLRAFISYLRENRLGINDKWQGKPFIHHALLNEATDIFDWLIRHNAKFQARSDDNKTFIDYFLQNPRKHPDWFRFLTVSRKRLLAYFSRYDLKALTTTLATADEEYFSLLTKQGLLAGPEKGEYKLHFSPEDIANLQNGTTHPSLTRKLSSVFGKFLPDARLLFTLYTLCSGYQSKVELPTGQLPIAPFDLIKSRHIVIGLLSLYSANEIFYILRKLYPYFGKTQKLMIFLVIKELIIHDSFGHCYRSSTFNKTLQEDFFAVAQPDCEILATPLLSKLAEMITLMQKKMATLRATYHQIGLLLARIRPTEGLISFAHLTPEDLAEELRKITLQCYQALSATEFCKLAWSKPETQGLAPTIGLQTAIANKLSTYLAGRILSAETLEERVAIISYFVKTISALLKDNKHPDIEAAMMLLSSFDTASISRLEKTFAALPAGIHAELEELRQRLDIFPNYKRVRELMESPEQPESLPHIGIYLKDLTIAHEIPSLDNKAEMLGKVYSLILAHLRTLSMSELPPLQSDLLQQLEHLELWNDKTLEALSLDAEHKPIRLNNDTSWEKICLQIAIVAKRQLPLQVFRNSELLTGEKAVTAIYTFMQEQASNPEASPEFKDYANIVEVLNRLTHIEEVKTLAEQYRLQAALLHATRPYHPSGSYTLPHLPTPAAATGLTATVTNMVEREDQEEEEAQQPHRALK